MKRATKLNPGGMIEYNIQHLVSKDNTGIIMLLGVPLPSLKNKLA